MNKYYYTCPCGHSHNIPYSAAMGSLIEVDEAFLDCSRCGQKITLEEAEKLITKELEA